MVKISRDKDLYEVMADYIEEWIEIPDNTELHVFLGFTREEWDIVIIEPDRIREILSYRN